MNQQFALGRLKTGDMNRTEQAYAAELELQKRTGLILWWKFEGIKLRLADKTFLTVDFAVMAADGTLEMREVKGYFHEDAKVKLKVAASLYPFRFRVIRRIKGRWEVEEF
jgi:hypothetical protein